ncbi:MAG: SprB repeat-containing protein, partial [Lewinella sp.]|nr:SprB repeat-containing protein [Lewinella sp.]
MMSSRPCFMLLLWGVSFLVAPTSLTSKPFDPWDDDPGKRSGQIQPAGQLCDLSLVEDVIFPDYCGQFVGSAAVTPVGGTPPFTYSWSGLPGVTDPIISGMGAGTYSVTVTDAADCTAILEVTIANVPGPTLSLDSLVDDPCTDNDLTVTLATTDGSSPFTYTWSHDPGLTGPVATGLSAGTYTISVTDLNGCRDTLSLDLTDAGQPTLAVSSVTDAECGLHDGQITVIPSGGTPPYQYAWSDGSLPSTAVVTDLAPGNYSVTLTDANGCTATAAASVAEFGGPILGLAGVKRAACNNNEGRITISVSAGIPPYQYTWSHQANLNAAVADGLAAGSYTVTVTDAAGCQRSLSATVGTVPPLNLGVNSFANAECTDGTGSIALQASGGLPPYTVSWNHNPQATGLSLNGLSAGTYTATLTDANGCTATINQTIELLPEPHITIFQQVNPDCAVANGLIEVGVFSDFLPVITWSHTDDEILYQPNLGPGDYGLTVTDILGCVVSTTITLDPAADISLAVTAQQPATCGGANGSVTVAVQNGPGNFTYQWSHDANLNSPTASGLPEGNYSVTVSGPGFCPATRSIQINNLAGPVIGTPTSLDSDCNATNGFLSFPVMGGTEPFDFSWSHNNNLHSATAFNLAGGTYTLTVTDANGCIATATASISDGDAPVATISGVFQPTCLNNDGVLVASVSGGALPYQYEWSHEEELDAATADNLSAGSYSLTVTDASGCYDIVSRTLEISNPFALQWSNVTPSFCSNGQGALTVTYSGGTLPLQYQWSHDAGATGPGVANLAAGAYSVTATDAAGCTAAISADISLEAPPALQFVSSQMAICSNVGSLTMAATGNGPFTYAWSHNPQLNSPVATGLAIGSYTLSVTDVNGCVSSLTRQVTGVTRPALSVQSVNPGCSGETGQISVQVTNSQPGPILYFWSHDAGLGSSLATGLPAGTYAVTVSNGAGCSSTASRTLTFTPGPTVALAGQSNSICTNDNGAIQLTAVGGNPPYTVNWSHDAQLNQMNISGLPGGNYSATVTDANGCTAIASTTVEFISGPVLSWGTVTNATCAGDDGELHLSVTNGQPPFTYAWGHDTGLTSATATGLVPGDYSVTVTDAMGCSATLTRTIVTNELLANLVTDNPPGCSLSDNGSLTVAASGGNPPYAYFWSTGAGGGQLTGLATGTYAVTVIDAAGCLDETSITLTAASDLQLDFNVSAPLCHGEANGQVQVMPSGGTGAYAYQWDAPGNPSSAQLTGLAPGDYQLTVTDGAGCVTAGMVTVPMTEPLALQTSATIACPGQPSGTASVQVNGGTEPYGFLWDDPDNQSTATANELSAATYTVTVTDGNGCQATAQAVVEAPEELLLSLAGVSAPLCAGEANGTATVEVTNGSGNYAFAWNDEQGQTTATMVGVNAGAYTVTVTDQANGCSTMLDVNIPATSALTVELQDITGPVCGDEAEGSVLAVASGGTGEYDFAWSDPQGQSAPLADQLVPGDYTLTVTDANGCTAEQAVTIPVGEVLVATIDSAAAPSCFGVADGSALVMVDGGAGELTYSWDDPASQQTPTVIGLSPGTYHVTVADAGGCTDTAMVSIPVTPQLEVELLAIELPSCAGYADGSLEVSVSGGTGVTSLLWDDPLSQSDALATDLAAGDYTVTVTDANACQATATYTLDDAVPLSLTTTQMSPLCSYSTDGSLTVEVSGGTGPYTYAWDDPEGQTSATATGLAGGAYAVTVLDDHGCTSSIAVELINTAQAIVWEDTLSDPSCLGGQDGAIGIAAIGGTGALTYLWDTGDSSNELTGLLAGDYLLTITDAVGCVASDTFSLIEGEPFVIELGPLDTTLCIGELLTYDFSDENYQLNWTGDQGFSSTDELVRLADPGAYTVMATNAAGCQDEDSVTLQFSTDTVRAFFYMP